MSANECAITQHIQHGALSNTVINMHFKSPLRSPQPLGAPFSAMQKQIIANLVIKTEGASSCASANKLKTCRGFEQNLRRFKQKKYVHTHALLQMKAYVH